MLYDDFVSIILENLFLESWANWRYYLNDLKLNLKPKITTNEN